MKITGMTLYKVPPRWLFLKVDTDEGICGWGEPIVEGRSRYTERGHYDDAVGRISESLHRRICFVDRQVSCTDGNPAVPRTRFFVGTFFHRGNPKVLILL